MQLIPGFQKFDISQQYTVTQFSCGTVSLDNFLKDGMTKQQERKILQAYVLITDDPIPEVMGYYTLSSASFEKTHLSGSQQRKVTYQTLPCVLLGRLAIDVRIQGKKFGELLIVDAAKRVYETSGTVGIYALFVEALDDRAANFYRKMGFTESAKSDDGKVFFYPTNQFDKLIGYK